jgi:uncharacterized membrane protein
LICRSTSQAALLSSCGGGTAAPANRLIYIQHNATQAWPERPETIMQTTIEQQPKLRGRKGPWQYQSSLPEGDGGAVQASPPDQAQRAFAAGRPRQEQRGAQLGAALGWLSIGLGLAALLAPRGIARAAGLPASTLLLRAIGVRELVCGIGLLNQPAAPAWRWSRVAGDAMDLAMLGVAARKEAPDTGRSGSARSRFAATAMVLAGVTALDVLASTRGAARKGGAARLAGEAAVPVEQSVTINRTADECYRYWRNLEQLPHFMQHLESVRVLDERRQHWKARGPAGTRFEWDAELTADEPGRRLAWRSVGSADVDNSGEVEFAPVPGGRGTTVTVRLRYAPPAGKLGAAAARLLGEEPSQQIAADLRRFKQLLETGEIATTSGQPNGRRSLKARLFGFAKGALK